NLEEGRETRMARADARRSRYRMGETPPGRKQQLARYGTLRRVLTVRTSGEQGHQSRQRLSSYCGIQNLCNRGGHESRRRRLRLFAEQIWYRASRHLLTN